MAGRCGGLLLLFNSFLYICTWPATCDTCMYRCHTPLGRPGSYWAVTHACTHALTHIDMSHPRYMYMRALRCEKAPCPLPLITYTHPTGLIVQQDGTESFCDYCQIIMHDVSVTRPTWLRVWWRAGQATTKMCLQQY